MSGPGFGGPRFRTTEGESGGGVADLGALVQYAIVDVEVGPDGDGTRTLALTVKILDGNGDIAGSSESFIGDPYCTLYLRTSGNLNAPTLSKLNLQSVSNGYPLTAYGLPQTADIYSVSVVANRGEIATVNFTFATVDLPAGDYGFAAVAGGQLFFRPFTIT